jgi:hypothetical protein
MCGGVVRDVESAGGSIRPRASVLRLGPMASRSQGGAGEKDKAAMLVLIGGACVTGGKVVLAVESGCRESRRRAGPRCFGDLKDASGFAAARALGDGPTGIWVRWWRRLFPRGPPHRRVLGSTGTRDRGSTRLRQNAAHWRYYADDERGGVAVRGGAAADGAAKRFKQNATAVIWKTRGYRRAGLPPARRARAPVRRGRGRRVLNGERVKPGNEKAAA